MNRIYVSAGVYTYETELRATSQSLGVTSVAIVGETLKGAAFQPFKVSNYNEFVTRFGEQNPTLMQSTNMFYKYPKYELPYIAKAFLSNANSLYVTRVLGLTGYNAGKAYLIKSGAETVAVLRSTGKYKDIESALEFDLVSLEAENNTQVDNFTLLVETANSTKEYIVSLNENDPNFIKKVLGTNPTNSQIGVFVEAFYGLEDYTSEISIVESDKFSNYKNGFNPSQTPWFVCEYSDSNIDKLFKCITISDGDNSSTEIKVSISNIDKRNQSFDLLVRAFNDKDESPIILERYTACTLDENSQHFIGKKIGTVDGKYNVRSKYIVIEFNTEIDLKGKVPVGFLGIPILYDNGVSPMSNSLELINYKTEYAPLDNKRKTFLGFSSKTKFNRDILKFFGEENLNYTNGFILSNSTNEFSINGEIYKLSTANFDVNNLVNNKFTALTYGGFDGWDIYREYRTNENQHAINQFYGSLGELDDTKIKKYGFDAMTLSSESEGLTSDYYAYLEGVRTFANPEETNVNVITVAGLDYGRNSALLNEIVDIVEEERADSIFIMTSPNSEHIDEIVSKLEDSGIESSYTATYFPWKQYNDTENGVYINLPVTMDVLSNIALVDKKRVPWFAVAGLDRGDVKCVKPLVNLTETKRGILNSGRVNPVQKWANHGTKIWGNRTLHPDGDAALSSLNVRRLILEARKLIASASLKLVFDQNDAIVRSQFINLVNPILENMRKERGLTDFRIDVDNSVESIQRKELRARILIKPTPALEYIIIEFGVSDQGVSFDDV